MEKSQNENGGVSTAVRQPQQNKPPPPTLIDHTPTMIKNGNTLKVMEGTSADSGISHITQGISGSNRKRATLLDSIRMLEEYHRKINDRNIDRAISEVVRRLKNINKIMKMNCLSNYKKELRGSIPTMEDGLAEIEEILRGIEEFLKELQK